MTSKYSVRWFRAACALACAALPLACSPPSEDLFPEAERLVLDAQWYDATTLWKRHLVMHPDDAGAHFYLGRCYMLFSDDDFYPRLAEGELQTALQMYKRSGATESPVPRFDAKYFEMICLVDSAKVFIRQMTLFLRNGDQILPMRHFIDRARHYAELAQAVMPETTEVRDTLAIINDFETQWRATPGGAAEYAPPKPPE